MTDFVVGWDLGGAHVKAALVREGRLVQIWQQPCPLWRGLEQLDRAMDPILAQLPPNPRHSLTMTGEMVDRFANRRQGVMALLTRFTARVTGPVWIFASTEFIPLSLVNQKTTKTIASGNWRLPGLWLARQSQTGLFVDIGSTTTDLLPLERGRLLCRGEDDHSRLCAGELRYAGVVRTPLMALAGEILFRGERVGLMAEHFATIADVYRLLGQLPSRADQAETADGGPKTAEASARRLARMVGLDAEDASMAEWQALARAFRERHWQQLTWDCLRQLGRLSGPAQSLIGAGVGRFLLPEVARRLGIAYRDFSELVSAETTTVFDPADCAPAAALALLLAADDGKMTG
ncbi:(4-(4-[2-(gamma-L-glutamylamino) ethyl]phenoxymethyl)furan-2-yl)methanamine synthase [Methylomarinovum caldicuralii]|uniref:(4-(4-[2-(Gamma-L-glutamylamino) ethyl]phenoxymethyl)furan-2-yl)methanamine synthase n=1 Tax=Methylomarinovum caldicuralii TaxID=438856 RepID=A0AAU9BZQ0_9GAMM|nr:hydantoinase/oxoprolinase family protein [Methylomarinovum caldicuralii]BCX81865.1 (4-(4-[2-(gamma-L-glutamylamino) ethyl]phenoxymethyl)furan-2-yl)methanamine synthase [Methylomarinovum caldicuralii]